MRAKATFQRDLSVSIATRLLTEYIADTYSTGEERL